MSKLGFMAIIFLSTQPVWAASVKLHYTDIEQILLSKNKDIQIAKINKNQSQYDLRSTYSGFLPSVTLYQDTTNTFDSTESSSKKVYSTSVKLTQNLFSGFQDYFKVNDAKLSLQQTENSLTIEQNNQISELKIAFASVLLSQRMVRFSERIIETRKGIKELVSLRLSSGNETKDSMLFADAQLDEAILNLETSKKSLEAAKRKLQFILGNELPEDYEASGDIALVSMPTSPDFKKIAIDSQVFQNAAITERRGIDDVRNNQAKFLPTIDFSVLRDRSDKRNFSEQNFNKSYSTKYVLSFTFPLFEGFTTYNSLKKSELENDKNRLNLTKTYEDYYSQLKDTFDKLMELKKRKEIYLKLLEAAKLRDMIDTSKYRLGIISFEIWISSQNDLISYEKNVIEIDFDIESNLSKWETLTNVRG